MKKQYDQLVDAIKKNDLIRIMEIIEENQDMLHGYDFIERNPLYIAVSVDNPDKDIIKYLAEKRNTIKNINKEEIADKSILMKSAEIFQDNVSEIIAILLENGENINEKSPFGGHTAFHIAAMVGNKRALQSLLNNGADNNIRTKNEYTALEYCLKYIAIYYDKMITTPHEYREVIDLLFDQKNILLIKAESLLGLKKCKFPSFDNNKNFGYENVKKAFGSPFVCAHKMEKSINMENDDDIAAFVHESLKDLNSHPIILEFILNRIIENVNNVLNDDKFSSMNYLKIDYLLDTDITNNTQYYQNILQYFTINADNPLKHQDKQMSEFIEKNMDTICSIFLLDKYKALQRNPELKDNINANSILGGKNIIHVAAMATDISYLETTLEKGTDYSARNKSGNTPLESCLESIHVSVERKINTPAEYRKTIDFFLDKTNTPLIKLDILLTKCKFEYDNCREFFSYQNVKKAFDSPFMLTGIEQDSSSSEDEVFDYDYYNFKQRIADVRDLGNAVANYPIILQFILNKIIETANNVLNNAKSPSINLKYLSENDIINNTQYYQDILQYFTTNKNNPLKHQDKPIKEFIEENIDAICNIFLLDTNKSINQNLDSDDQKANCQPDEAVSLESNSDSSDNQAPNHQPDEAVSLESNSDSSDNQALNTQPDEAVSLESNSDSSDNQAPNPQLDKAVSEASNNYKKNCCNIQ